MMPPWIPRFVVATPAIDLTLTWPMSPWAYAGQPEGVHRWSQALHLAAHETFYPRDLILTLRVTERERAAFETLVATLRLPGITATFYPDAFANITSASYEIEIVSPGAGESLADRFARLPEFPPVFTFEMTIRPTGDPIELEYIPLTA